MLKRRLRGFSSGRQIHSPAPVHSDRPSVSWISGRQSQPMRRSFSPTWYMLVHGAMPNRSIALRGYSALSMSISSTSPLVIAKR